VVPSTGFFFDNQNFLKILSIIFVKRFEITHIQSQTIIHSHIESEQIIFEMNDLTWNIFSWWFIRTPKKERFESSHFSLKKTSKSTNWYRKWKLTKFCSKKPEEPNTAHIYVASKLPVWQERTLILLKKLYDEVIVSSSFWILNIVHYWIWHFIENEIVSWQ
jgi:hypothetical protein